MLDNIYVMNMSQSDLMIIGWVHNDNHRNMINQLVKSYNITSRIYVKFWAINMGKYQIIYEMITLAREQSYDVICYSDHDIIFNMEINYNAIIHNIIDNNNNYGYIAFNQDGDCRHQNTIYEIHNKLGNHTIVRPAISSACSIADGAFMITDKLINKYNDSDKVTNSVYGLDDYHIIKLCDKYNVCYGVAKDIYVTHPYDDNITYLKWKYERIRELSYDDNDINYYETVQQSHNFWQV